jgi:hypothetical protein
MIPHSLCPFKLWRHNEDEIHEFILIGEKNWRPNTLHFQRITSGLVCNSFYEGCMACWVW